MDALENLEARLEQHLGLLGLDDAFRPGGVTAVDAGDAVVLLSAFAQDGEAWVRISSIVLVDVEPSVALLHHLLTRNHDVLLGGFHLFEDRTLGFAVTLPGATLDPDGLTHTLKYVAAVAAEHGPDLRELAGGATWAEALAVSPC